MSALRLLTASLALALAACGTPTPTPEPVPSSTGSGRFGPTDVAFAELSVATGEQAVRLADLGSRRATGPALRSLAADTAAARRAELTELRGLLAAAAVPYADQHRGHDMPGMPTDVELDALGAAGADFDLRFTTALRAHLEESATVVASAVDSPASAPETVELAERMRRDRHALLERLNRLG
ncbi:DUF305 domain-containing protein [Umezawaea beigongshangensis]|uniref:DUF305 domain-containing protein n=1 Tax=Umezawaea beigongshangensis TaxID=2780383 RepID=UPI0018F2433E|nr:DUF305 domain-containing protein [Umezawaea beigongshangensis]